MDSRAGTGDRAVTEHEHDWRVDPNVILTSYPPQRRLVCAECGATKASGIDPFVLAQTNFSREPSDWPKWKP